MVVNDFDQNGTVEQIFTQVVDGVSIPYTLKHYTRDPVTRLRAYLVAQGHWSEAEEAEWKRACDAEVDVEVNAYLETRSQPVEAMFDYLYAELPADLQAQRADAIKWEGR